MTPMTETKGMQAKREKLPASCLCLRRRRGGGGSPPANPCSHLVHSNIGILSWRLLFLKQERPSCTKFCMPVTMMRSTIITLFFITALGAAIVRAEAFAEDVPPLNTTDCDGVSFEGDVDCTVEHPVEPMTNGTECSGISFNVQIDCDMIGSVENAGGEEAGVEMVVGTIPDLESSDEDLLMQTTAFELFFRPAWTGALSRTLMGWNSGSPAQLTSHVPGDTSTTYDLNLLDLCKDDIGGSFLNSGNVGYCYVEDEWTQLVSGVPGISASFPSMESTCIELGGHPIGSNKQYCALKGAWTQLYERVPGASSWTSGLENICDEIDGTRFSGINSNFCFVRGHYSQFSTRMAGDSSWTSSFPRYLCDDMNGHSFGTMCIVEGLWAQLTTKLPFETSWATYFPSSVCDGLGGDVFADRFCAVEGPHAQLSTKMVGDTQWQTYFPSSVCSALEGSVFADRHCAVSGQITQLSTRLPDDNRWPTYFPSSVCDNFDGQTFADRYCAAKGPVSQLTTRYPGVTSWATYFPQSVCDKFQGSTFADRYCGAKGPSPGPSPTSSAPFLFRGRSSFVALTLIVASSSIVFL